MASLRQKFHLLDKGLMAAAQPVGSGERPTGGGELFDERFHPGVSRGHPSVSHK